MKWWLWHTSQRIHIKASWSQNQNSDQGGWVGRSNHVQTFFVSNFCIILNNFSRNPLETFHGDSESVRVDDLLRLILKLRIAVKRCNYNKEGGGSTTVWTMLKRPQYWYGEGSLSGQDEEFTRLVDFLVQTFFLSKVYHKEVSFKYRAFIELLTSFNSPIKEPILTCLLFLKMLLVLCRPNASRMMWTISWLIWSVFPTKECPKTYLSVFFIIVQKGRGVISKPIPKP